MIEVIKIERNKPAPRRKFGNGKSNWKELFDSMKVGDWFVIDTSYRARVGVAANAYLKGKYSLYMHPEKDSKYIFTRLK